ncbi:MAG: glutamine-hydrolyzing GMP synthase [Planctomycetota bacterium]
MQTVLVFDFGSQYNQLIARRVREKHVYAEIVSHATTAADVRRRDVVGIILSGGPASVYHSQAPTLDPQIFSLGIPVLGICYGLQVTAAVLGAKVRAAERREYGRRSCSVSDHADLFYGLPSEITVWMSHGDQLTEMSSDFEALASTDTCPYAAVRHRRFPFFGVQFHPEVTHTPRGPDIIENFLYRICKARGDWTMGSFIESEIKALRERIGSDRVILGLSGGVDSSVVAVLLYHAVGDRLEAVFVDNGVLRKNEAERVLSTFRDHLKMSVHFVDASDRFLAKLAGVDDPETKRKVVGHEFIEVFKEKARDLGKIRFLAQGTLYPDVIESVSAKGGPTAKIKSHHNVAGLPAELGFELVEPVRELFKDEVREVGRRLNLPAEIVQRQPFPGPGLAVRILGEVTRERVRVLQDADEIVHEEMVAAGLYDKVWQSFPVLLPVRSVGVMGDERTYEKVIALRVVESLDGMTADWVKLPYDLLGRMSNRIINEVRGVNRVVYDISSKPPATIEWE